jgi:NTP-dependent ternary conflict system VMAP-like protein/trypsin-like peptidase
MAEQPQWLARIETAGAKSAGCGVLVDRRRVLTWAEVLQGQDEARITLMDGRGPRRAEVVDRPGPAGRLAVLELDEPVPVVPAVFAPDRAPEIYAGRRLTAVGFPEDHGRQATIVYCHADPSTVAGQGGVQLTAERLPGSWSEAGLAGAAVYHQESRRVVGLITDPGRGIMTPAAELARLWPYLAELVDFPTFTPRAYRELRAVLGRMTMPAAVVQRLQAQVEGSVPTLGGQRSILALAEAIVLETVVPAEMHSRLHTFLYRLGQEPGAPVADLRRWIDAYLWEAALRTPDRPAEPRTGAIVVQLAPSAADEAETYEMTVWTADGADGQLDVPVVVKDQLSRSALKDAVEAALPQAWARIPLDAELVFVEFVMTGDWLSAPVDEWIARFDDNTLLGVSRPVAVRDLDAVYGDLRDLRRRVRALRDAGLDLGEVLQWRDCGDPLIPEQSFKAWLRRADGPLGLGLAGEWTHHDRIWWSVRSGMPVMVWHRGACAVEQHAAGFCRGLKFHADLTEHLRGVSFDAVAERVRQLRAEALFAGDDQHCGSGITLLWDDARRRPMPLELAET